MRGERGIAAVVGVVVAMGCAAGGTDRGARRRDLHDAAILGAEDATVRSRDAMSIADGGTAEDRDGASAAVDAAPCAAEFDDDCAGAIDAGTSMVAPAAQGLWVDSHDVIVRTAAGWVGWGFNSERQLGLSSEQLAPVELPALAGARDVARGFLHACMITAARGVSCLGRARYGALGPAGAPGAVEGVSDVVALVAGTDASCALHDDGDLTCWGYDAGLGRGGDVSSFDATPSPEGTNIARAALGPHTLCTIDREGTARCRGTVPLLEPVEGVESIAAGYTHGCLIKRGGALECWGSAELLGVPFGGASARRPVPVPLEGVVQVSAGYYHTCARTDAGEVWCWGTAPSGHAATPTRVAELPPAIEVRTRFLLTCARGIDESVWCWGHAPIGDGTRETSMIPVRVIP
jgi:hypothetical protein